MTLALPAVRGLAVSAIPANHLLVLAIQGARQVLKAVAWPGFGKGCTLAEGSRGRPPSLAPPNAGNTLHLTTPRLKILAHVPPNAFSARMNLHCSGGWHRVA